MLQNISEQRNSILLTNDDEGFEDITSRTEEPLSKLLFENHFKFQSFTSV